MKSGSWYLYIARSGFESHLSDPFMNRAIVELKRVMGPVGFEPTSFESNYFRIEIMGG
jgi:hypothetical protein